MTATTPELSALAKQAATKLDQQNPAAKRETRMPNRIPLSVPQRKLETPEIPGFYLRWFRGTTQRINQALQAGFVFVEPEEIALNNLALGGDAKKDGNSDMGNRVSVIEGSDVESGQAVRMFLMKQPMEYKIKDDAILQERNDSVAEALTANFARGTIGAGAQAGESSDDVNARYVDKSRSKIPALFRKKSGPQRG